MSCCNDDGINCGVTQILEPDDDVLVETGGATSDLDERGEVALHAGQINAIIYFLVPKLNAEYHFEYLYVDAMGDNHPGAVQVVPTIRLAEGFAVAFAGSPLNDLCVLHWRVTIVKSSSLVQLDLPEDLYLQMPRTNTMAVTFHNPRSGVSYGFSELRVENLIDPPSTQAIIHVQVAQKTTVGFLLGVNPTPRTDHFFLKVRTP